MPTEMLYLSEMDAVITGKSGNLFNRASFQIGERASFA